jgi:hypothetical protein
LTGDRTDVIGLDDALGAAAVTSHRVTVVTSFALIEDAVSAARTGISLDTSLRSVASGTYIRQRDKDTCVSAGVPIFNTASGPADAAATRTGSHINDSVLAGTGARNKAHNKPPSSQT